MFSPPHMGSGWQSNDRPIPIVFHTNTQVKGMASHPKHPPNQPPYIATYVVTYIQVQLCSVQLMGEGGANISKNITFVLL